MQPHALKQHYGGKLRLTDINEMFLLMRDEVSPRPRGKIARIMLLSDLEPRFISSACGKRVPTCARTSMAGPADQDDGLSADSVTSITPQSPPVTQGTAVSD
jgi:hypothetical protein